MWWYEFGRQLTNAFNNYYRLEKRIVHSNDTRLRILNIKILEDFVQSTKSSINSELAKTYVTITYGNALGTFRNQVNQKSPPEISSSNNINTRTINESGTCGGGRGGRIQYQGVRYQGRVGRGRSGESGRDRSGRGHGKRGNHRRSRKDSGMVRCNDGS